MPESFSSLETSEAYVIDLLALGNDRPVSAPATKANRAILYGRDRGGVEGKQAAHILCEDGTGHVFGDLSGIRTFDPGAVLQVNGLDGSTDILRLVGSNGTTRFGVTDSGSVSGLLSFSGALTVSLPALGTTSTDGLVLTNPTAAATGAQQISPRTRWTGQGWKTNAPAGSQAVDYVAELVPVQGAAPQARLDFNYQINNGGYTTALSLLNGNIGIGTTGPLEKLAVKTTTANANSSFYVRIPVNLSDGVSIYSANDAASVNKGFELRGAPILIGANSSNGSSNNYIAFNSDISEKMRIDANGNLGIGTTVFGANAASVLALGGPATAPTTRPASIIQLYPINVVGAGTMGLAWMSEDNGIGILGSRNGFGLQNPTAVAHLAAGTATLAPLKLTAGTNLTTPEAGAVEYNGTLLFLTDGTATRRTIYSTGGTKVALADGGLNASLVASNGGIFYSTAAAGAILAGTATANQMLLSGASAAPAWSTATYPSATTINQLLYSSAANVIAGLATANNGVLVTGATGIPAIATDIPTAVTIGGGAIYRVGGTKVAVADGGTGVGSWTNGQLLVGNTTGNTAALATLTGTANQITVTNGASTITLSLPQDIAAASSPTHAGLTITSNLTATATTLGFYGVAAIVRPLAYTQTYALATRTHSSFTSADLATTASTQTTPWGFATAAQADNIATQFNALRVDITNLKQLVNSAIDDLQAVGLLQ